MRIFALLLVAPVVFAAPPVHLTLQQAIETALRQNPSVLLTSRLFSSRKDFSQAALAINCLTVA